MSTARGIAAAAILLLPTSGRSGDGPPAASYVDAYREVLALTPTGEAAQVTNLVIRREAAVLMLDRGVLYPLSQVGGRTIGAVFEGTGRFSLTPPLAVERSQIQRFAGAPVLEDTITRAVLLFADATGDELRRLTFTAAAAPRSVGDAVGDLLGTFKGDHEGSFDGSIMAPILNGESNGFFLAHLRRTRGDPVLFRVDPDLSEPVRLLRPVGKLRWGRHWALVAQFPAAQPAAGTVGAWSYRDRLAVPHHELDVRLTPTGGGDLDFAARATLHMVAVEPVGPWLRFGLHWKLLVDSARWADGSPAPVFKAKENGDLWVRAARRLAAGDSLVLTLYYRGNLIDRYDNWFYIDPGADWWPTNRQGRDWTTFDITYHSPNWYPIASVGERVDSSARERVMTTRWVAPAPTPFATFNLGLFEQYRVQHEGAPEIQVLISEDAHRLLKRQLLARGMYLPQQRNMRENVAADISNSLKWFTHLFGEPPFQRYFVTEIPYFLGVSFPGVIHLSWVTFQNTSIEGFDEAFRAHEAAHQWWGNAVRPASYRDAWLAEGLAEFSGLWYLQTARKRNDEYFKFLDQYAGDIRANRTSAGPIWLGYRNATPDTPSGYQVLTYEKGAWVFHMLRTLLFDLQTRKEDRFAAMLRDFHESYRGRTATTDDFQRLVERHAGLPMDWFFDQWVRGTDLPTYRVAWTNEPTDGGRHRVRLRVTQEGVSPTFQAFVLVSADLGDSRFAHFRVGVHGGETEYLSPILPAPAKRITFNELRSVLADVKMERW